MKFELIFLFSLFALFLAEAKFDKKFKIIGYYPNWYGDFSKKVPWDKLTHVYYAFGLPDGKGKGKMESLEDYEDVIEPMIKNAESHGVIPVLSVGGWSYTDGRLCAEVFEANTDSTEKCETLAKSIVDSAINYGFKGIDIDWEYPKKSTQKQYTTFMKQLRELCNDNDMILTVAVSATNGAGFSNEVLELLDFVNLMAYDGDEGAGHSPYSYAVNSFTYWKETMGVDSNKLMIGVPFYEHPTWNAYADIIKDNEKNAQKDSTEFKGETIYYNGIPTMKKKAEYAAKNAGGIMIWELSQDSRDEDLSLLNAIYETCKSVLG